MPIVIGGRSFPDKKLARDYITSVLCHRRYKPGDALAKEHQALVVELLSFHPQAPEKIGCGVRRILIGYCEFSGHRYKRSFWIERADMTLDDFSYMKCIRRIPETSAVAA